jgi:hypothetical protein
MESLAFAQSAYDVGGMYYLQVFNTTTNTSSNLLAAPGYVTGWQLHQTVNSFMLPAGIRMLRAIVRACSRLSTRRRKRLEAQLH